MESGTTRLPEKDTKGTTRMLNATIPSVIQAEVMSDKQITRKCVCEFIDSAITTAIHRFPGELLGIVKDVGDKNR